MASVGNILLDKEILLESGTNELELLVFKVAHFTFGINVAKVREILPAMSIHKLPQGPLVGPWSISTSRSGGALRVADRPSGGGCA